MKILLSVAALVTGAALVAASALARPEATRGGTLRVLLDTDIDYVDPALAYYLPTWQIEYATCSMLVNHPGAGGRRSVQLVPDGAAAMPTISRDGRIYTFRIRAGLRFSDGTLITAWNYAYALNRVLSRRMSSPAQGFFDDIAGAAEVIEGDAQRASGIRVLRGNRLRISLTAPAFDFLARLAMPFACAIKTNTPIDLDGIPAPVVGSGPYYIHSWRPRRRLELRRNRFYTGRRPRNVDRVVYSVLRNQSLAFDAVERGEADWYTYYGSALNDRFAASPRARVNPSLGVGYLAFNVQPGKAFSNPRLRRAVALAIDRTELAAAQRYVLTVPWDKFLPPGMPGARSGRVYPLRRTPESLAQARALAAPYAPVIVYYGGTAAAPPEPLRTQLADIGIEVRTHGTRRCDPGGCSTDLALFGAVPAYGDPTASLRDVLEHSLSDGPRSSLPFPDRRWLRRLRAANRLEGHERLAALGQLDVRLARDAVPGVPFGVIASRELFSARVGCFRFHRVYHVDLAGLCLRR